MSIRQGHAVLYMAVGVVAFTATIAASRTGRLPTVDVDVDWPDQSAMYVTNDSLPYEIVLVLIVAPQAPRATSRDCRQSLRG